MIKVMSSAFNIYDDSKCNWLALFLSIVKGISPDKALMAMFPANKRVVNIKLQKTKTEYVKFPEIEVEKMIELKKAMSYKQIAEMYNTCDRNIYRHIKKYRPDLIKTGVFNNSKRDRTKIF